MARKWTTTPLPLQGSGGEQRDAAAGLIEPGRAKLLRNGVIVGPGVIGQEADWLKADTCKNIAGPVEGHGVCGIFPFAQQGGASAPSAGVAFHFNGTDGKVYLHQLGELATILRTLEAFATFTNPLPPQVTAFEMFGKFYFVPYRPDEAASVRKGMGVFDPAGAGAIAFPTFVLGGGAAAVLKFRGIALHRGGTILGWGYRSESDIDQPHVLRYSKYGAPDTWVPDTTDTTAGAIDVGTLKLPIVACAMSGQYTIIGKETEVFSLDGDFSSQFYTRRIGVAHGPVSTVGMVEIPEAAVWMALKGPVISSNGNPIELLGVDRVQRRFLSYMDLTTCWAVHDADRQRVLWGMRRKDDEDGTLVTSPYLSELLWWDYARDAFGTRGLPAPIFSLGTIRGPGISLAGPTGVVSAITATNVAYTTVTIGWTPGDASSDVTFQVQYRVNGTSLWTDGGTTAPGVATKNLSGLSPATQYDVQVKQIRNGQSSAYVQSLALFTTTAVPPAPAAPANAAVLEIGSCYCIGGTRYEAVRATWDAFSAPGAIVVVYRSTTNSFASASAIADAYPQDGQLDVGFYVTGTSYYFWLRSELVDFPLIVSASVQCAPAPLAIASTGGTCDGTCGGGGGGGGNDF